MAGFLTWLSRGRGSTTSHGYDSVPVRDPGSVNGLCSSRPLRSHLPHGRLQRRPSGKPRQHFHCPARRLRAREPTLLRMHGQTPVWRSLAQSGAQGSVHKTLILSVTWLIEDPYLLKKQTKPQNNPKNPWSPGESQSEAKPRCLVPAPHAEACGLAGSQRETGARHLG